jgi:hypothetical protein
MGRFVTVLIVALTQASCGGTDTPPPTLPLDTGFAKIWNGVPTVTCPGQTPVTYATYAVDISVSGTSLSTKFTCSDPSGTSVTATGSMTATGSGKTATWTGSFSCPSNVVAGCPSGLVFTHTSRTYTLNADGTLTASGAGTLSCGGITTDCTTSFQGT